jgi:hypothetical protein
VKLYLDDVRTPPDGWTLAKTVAAAKAALLTGTVEHASLDHDLGVCDACDELGDQAVDVRTCPTDCTHTCHETDSDLVRWMAETDTWPQNKPRVHSANPVGAAYMRGVIDRYWHPQ